MRILLIGLCWLCMATTAFPADDMKNIRSAQDSLERTLMTLRESADRITVENKVISDSNDSLRVRLEGLQGELAALQRDAARIQEQSDALAVKYERRWGQRPSAEIQSAQLKEEFYTLDAQVAELSRVVMAREAEESEMRSAVKRAEDEVRQLKTGPALDLQYEPDQLTAERDQLKVQLQESRLALQKTRDSWLEWQGVSQGGPGQGEALAQDRKALLARIADKRASVSQLTEKILSTEQSAREMMASKNVNPATVTGLEQDIALLNEQQRRMTEQLLSIENENSQKVKKENVTLENEKQKWQAKVAEESASNQKLRAQLNGLRKAMVEMDKKKVALEQAVYGK